MSIVTVSVVWLDAGDEDPRAVPSGRPHCEISVITFVDDETDALPAPEQAVTTTVSPLRAAAEVISTSRSRNRSSTRSKVDIVHISSEILASNCNSSLSE